MFYLGHDEDGDVYKPKNILSLERYVMKMTEGKGVHFVMADGVSNTYIKIKKFDEIYFQVHLCIGVFG